MSFPMRLALEFFWILQPGKQMHVWKEAWSWGKHARSKGILVREEMEMADAMSLFSTTFWDVVVLRCGCQLKRRSFAWVTGKMLVSGIVQTFYFCWAYRWILAVPISTQTRSFWPRFGFHVSDIIISYSNYLFVMLGSLPVWACKDVVKQHLPTAFKGRLENIRCHWLHRD